MQPPHRDAVIDALKQRRVEFVREASSSWEILRISISVMFPMIMPAVCIGGRRLGLSLIGVDLNREEPLSLLSRNGYGPLEKLFSVGFINGPVSRLVDRLGFRSAMLSFVKDRSQFLEISRSFLDNTRRLVSMARDNGFSAVALADDIAGNSGLLFSPRHFQGLVLPVYREFASIVKSEGLFTFIHSDGDMRQVIGHLIEEGYDCLHPVDTQAKISLAELQKEYGERICLMGHIDLLGWDAERIRNEVDQAEESKTGGIILGSTGGIPVNVSDDNLCALYPGWTAGERQG